MICGVKKINVLQKINVYFSNQIWIKLTTDT